ncbi:MAG: pilus assembly protein [Gammaproteobacteria bacterium]
MRPTCRKFRASVVAASIALLTGAAGTAHASLNLPNVPLFLGQQVVPNVLFVMDNSGSMDWEVMTVPHWEFDAYDPDNANRANFASNNSGAFRTNDGRWRAPRFFTHQPSHSPPPPPPPPSSSPSPPPPPPAPYGLLDMPPAGLQEVGSAASAGARFMDPAQWQGGSQQTREYGLIKPVWTFDPQFRAVPTSHTVLSYAEEEFAYLFDTLDNVQNTRSTASERCANSQFANVAGACGPGPGQPQSNRPRRENTPIGKDWRIISSGLNRIYYNADRAYEPWRGTCLPTTSGACPDASFTAARSNPYEDQPGYSRVRNLGTQMGGTRNGGLATGGIRYAVWIDDKGFSGSRPRRGGNSNATAGANGLVDLWDSHMQFEVKANTIDVYRVTYFPNRSSNNPYSGKPRGLNETGLQDESTGVRTPLETLDDASLCYDVLGPQSLVTQIFTQPSTVLDTDTPGCRTIGQAQDNLANWYTYHRRRAFAAKSSIAEVLKVEPRLPYGLTTLSPLGSTEEPSFLVEIPPINDNDNLLRKLFDYRWTGATTPLRTALEKAGEYYRSTGNDSAGNPIAAGRNALGLDDPIVHECQHNFSVLLSDGFYTGDATPRNVTNDEDNDGNRVTLADVAQYYYDLDLSDLVDNVVPTGDNPKTSQHMTTIGVAFGVTGNLRDTDVPPDGWPNPNGVPGKRLNERGQTIDNDNYVANSGGARGGWGDPNPSNWQSNRLAKLDDLWHASYNSRGVFAAANDPGELVTKLIETIKEIGNRSASASATASNSARLSAGARIYSATFESADWSGDLFSQPISLGTDPPNDTCTLFDDNGTPNDASDDSGDPPGALCAAEWGAQQKLDGQAHGARVILTADPISRRGVAFDWATLSAAQQAALNATDGQGQQRLAYLRGDATNEIPSGSFRQRSHKLGDISGSDPAYVGPPSFFYPDNLEGEAYSGFRDTYKNRTPVIYVGANDGMLHGFKAVPQANGGGEEIIAYVPDRLFGNLSRLSAPDYIDKHRFFVDGDPVVGDAFFAAPDDSNAKHWHTILIGTLARGGQGVFALNVSNPDDGNISDDDTFSESNAADLGLWEFTDEDDRDLGFTMQRGNIVRMHNGRWAVVIGNGYDNTDTANGADTDVSTRGNAALYILYLEGPGNNVWDEGRGASDDYVKLDTSLIDANAADPVNPNGLSEVVPVDIDNDFVIDYIYGGDLYGNLWKFDVTDPDPANWTTVKYFTTQGPNGAPQPITARPTVGRHPTDNSATAVYFGTGALVEVQDGVIDPSTPAQTQSFYALYDPLLDGRVLQALDRSAPTPGVPPLLKQQIMLDDGASVFSSDDAISWATPQAGGAWSGGPHQGWYIDLVAQQIDDDGDPLTPPVANSDNYGQRVVVTPFLRNGRVFFTITLPLQNPCDPAGAASIFMALNANNGGRPTTGVFDTNNDGVVNDSDRINAGVGNQIVAGRRLQGWTEFPSFVNRTEELVDVYVGGTEGLQRFLIAEPGSLGRQSWRQLRPTSSFED